MNRRLTRNSDLRHGDTLVRVGDESEVFVIVDGGSEMFWDIFLVVSPNEGRVLNGQPIKNGTIRECALRKANDLQGEYTIYRGGRVMHQV